MHETLSGANHIIHIADALKVLDDLPTGCVDAVITDPPYCSGGTTNAERKAGTGAKYNKDMNGVQGFAGDTRDQRAFQYWAALWMGEAYRVTKPGGLIMCFTDWRQMNATADSVQAGGWVWRGTGVWGKPEWVVRPQKGRFTHAAEFWVWGTKGPRAIDYKSDDPSVSGLFISAPPRGNAREHQTQKPVDLLRHMMRLLAPGSTVLDSFAGSGSTGVAALSLGHAFIGIELSHHYAEVAHLRCLKATLGHVPQGDQTALDLGSDAA